jgi:glyoxylase-like metal-dependent hydrolase (beta-lactamase superfamily II)
MGGGEWSMNMIKAILTTHKHNNHSAGNVGMQGFLKKTIRIVGHELDDVPGCTNRVPDKGTLDGRVPWFKVTCHHTPGHTRGHMMYEVCPETEIKEETKMEKINGFQVMRNVNRALFTGDTLFVGGCGKSK